MFKEIETFISKKKKGERVCDPRDSHAALLVATNEVANEVINLRNDITSHFQKQSHILSDSQGWTSVGKNRRPIDIQNKFKALEVPDGEISPKVA